MRKTRRLWRALGSILALVIAIPTAVWFSLTHKPDFYRTRVQVPRAQREAKAKRFVAQSLQLRNDICNEAIWEAVFTDQEVNAWLAEDLVTEFADQLPPEVHEPRVVFELDHVTLAFELDQGPFTSVIWVVARPSVPKPNVLELTLEKIRAGVLPVPAEKVIDRIVAHVRDQGVDVSWKRVDKLPVVVARYEPHSGRDDVLLEQLQVLDGEIRLSGRSNRAKGVVSAPTLPTRKVLQSKFPRRRIQVRGVSIDPPSTWRKDASPTS